jgi:thiol-disulfide isomerase/thioredoxin
MKRLSSAILLGLALGSALPVAYAGVVKPDPRAMALLQKEAATVQAIHSITANYQVVFHFPQPSGPDHQMNSVISVAAMRPNYVLLTVSNVNKSPKTGQWGPKNRSISFESNGNSLLTLASNDTYQKVPAQTNGHDLKMDFVEALEDFFNPQFSAAAQVAEEYRKSQLRRLKYAGTETWNGKIYQVIEWQHTNPIMTADFGKSVPGGVVIEYERFDIGQDNLIHRSVERSNLGGVEVDSTLGDIQVNPPLTKTDFAIKLPADAHVQAPPPVLLTNGTEAPDFTVHDKDGKLVTLSDYRGKVVVLDFWATWCMPCQESLPHTNKVAEEYKDKNVVVLAVNTSDTAKAFQAWLPKHKDYEALVFAIDPAPSDKNIATTLYHVSGIPTQYVIAPDGKIVQSFVGYGGPNDDLANAIQKAMKETPG